MTATAVEWEAVIGLEVHAQLRTDTKMFCGCKASFGDPPNSHVCPVCLGLPGSLPVMNGKAFKMALKAALALNCRIAGFTKADRKNYYYPDLPKNYQISQYDLPFATKGWLDLTLPDGARKRIAITRVHIEEDAGKLVHDESGGGSGVDLNRAGTPLIEIVSDPDLRSPAEARAYMEALAQVLLYLDVCDGNMQEGSLRCDANVSVRPKGQPALNTRREIKNMNSFRFVEMAVEAEIREQRALYEAGGTVEQSTRLFNGQTGEIRTMRTKEHAQDYRYFPEPDLPPVTIAPEMIAAVRAEIGEMPDARLRRYREQSGLSAYDAGVLVEHKALGDYFEQLLAAGAAAKAAANWIISDCQGVLKEKGLRIENCGITPARMADLLRLVEAGTINRATAKDKVLPVMLETGKDAAEIVTEKGLAQVSDSAAIEKTVDEVLAKNPKLVQDYVGGKDATLNAIFGQCMKAFQGKANPGVIRPMLERKLKALRERK
jgi:aspartyl-tRNA(Asn)/glutamyl-tRNA(Gln) amidotransferase subunit B